MLTRREMLVGSAAAAVAAPTSGLAAVGRQVVAVLGDTHFDRWTHHDRQWLEQEKPGDIRQIDHYTQHTTELLPKLFDAVREQLAATDPSCVVHVGDLVEGLCGTPALARRHCEEAVEFVTDARLGAPLLLTKGNHDVTGPGAKEAYEQIVLPFLSRQCQHEVKLPWYAVERGCCQFVMYDTYDRSSLDWLEATLQRRSAPHLIVVAHQPIVPFQARGNWSVFMKESEADDRRRLLRLLGRHRAIVLVGHVHRWGVVARQTEDGTFVQLATSSILAAVNETPKQVLRGVADYTPELVDLEPRYQPETKDLRRTQFSAERPAIKYFEHANTGGYALLHIDADRISAQVFAGASVTPWREFSLTDLLRS